MLAVRRADVTGLNDTTRERLLESGQLGRDAVLAGDGTRQREYRAGDRVLVIANDHHLDLLNGTRACIAAVDPRGSTLTVVTEDHQQVTIPVGWAARHLDHGYAMTCHKAQGATVDVALVYGAGGLTREAGYVGLSRGRTANHLYVPERDDRDPLGVGDDLGPVAARLATRRTQTLATRQLPRHASDSWLRHQSHQALPASIEGIAR